MPFRSGPIEILTDDDRQGIRHLARAILHRLPITQRLSRDEAHFAGSDVGAKLERILRTIVDGRTIGIHVPVNVLEHHSKDGNLGLRMIRLLLLLL